MDGEFLSFEAELDSEAHTLTLTQLPKGRRPDFFYLSPPPAPATPPPVYSWHYTLDEQGALELEGKVDSQPLELLAVPIPLDFELPTRGFNWINEVPRNI